MADKNWVNLSNTLQDGREATKPKEWRDEDLNKTGEDKMNEKVK